MNAVVRPLKPVGIPDGVDPRTWRQAIEAQLNELLDHATALITALDLMEADCDLELEDGDGGDINDEPQDDDEREADDAEYDCPGQIAGGQGV